MTFIKIFSLKSATMVAIEKFLLNDLHNGHGFKYSIDSEEESESDSSESESSSDSADNEEYFDSESDKWRYRTFLKWVNTLNKCLKLNVEL